MARKPIPPKAPKLPPEPKCPNCKCDATSCQCGRK